MTKTAPVNRVAKQTRTAQLPGIAVLLTWSCIVAGVGDGTLPMLAAQTRGATKGDADAVLRRKIECREVGVRAEKEQFPGGKNTVGDLNLGFMYFDSVFAYSEGLNTCSSLSGFQLMDLKSKRLTTFQATLTDTLANRVLETYFVLGNGLAPVSVSRSVFLARTRELLGEPLPKWLEQSPVR